MGLSWSHFPVKTNPLNQPAMFVESKMAGPSPEAAPLVARGNPDDTTVIVALVVEASELGDP